MYLDLCSCHSVLKGPWTLLSLPRSCLPGLSKGPAPLFHMAQFQLSSLWGNNDELAILLCVRPFPSPLNKDKDESVSANLQDLPVLPVTQRMVCLRGKCSSQEVGSLSLHLPESPALGAPIKTQRPGKAGQERSGICGPGKRIGDEGLKCRRLNLFIFWWPWVDQQRAQCPYLKMGEIEYPTILIDSEVAQKERDVSSRNISGWRQTHFGTFLCKREGALEMVCPRGFLGQAIA